MGGTTYFNHNLKWTFIKSQLWYSSMKLGFFGTLALLGHRDMTSLCMQLEKFNREYKEIVRGRLPWLGDRVKEGERQFSINFFFSLTRSHTCCSFTSSRVPPPTIRWLVHRPRQAQDTSPNPMGQQKHLNARL